MSRFPVSRFQRGMAISTLTLLTALTLPAQAPDPLSTFFEGKHVVVKLDMPATQQGVDIYPQRPQPLDLNSYSNRIKKFGTSLRNGDSTMITRIRVKDKSIELQLGGGGYGTFMDDTDTSTHFSPTDKSGREKDLEDQLKSETDPDRRRYLKRKLEDARSDRERRDQRDRIAAQDEADARKDRIASKRLGGGSRFNLRYESRLLADQVTPEAVMTALAQYVTFPVDTVGNGGDPQPSAAAADSLTSLKKGLTLAEVKDLFGQPISQQDRNQDGMTMTLCTFKSKSAMIKADFVNGVLVGYTVSSR
jgi:hypothetical protein